MKMKLISRDETYPFEIDSYVTEYDIDFATNPDSLARDYEVANKMKATLVVPKSNYKDENVQTLLSWSDEPYNSEHYYQDIALNLQAAGNNERTLVFTHAALKASVSGETRGDKVTITLNINQKKDKMVGVLFGEDVDTTYDQALWRVMHPPRVGIVVPNEMSALQITNISIVQEKEYINYDQKVQTHSNGAVEYFRFNKLLVCTDGSRRYSTNPNAGALYDPDHQDGTKFFVRIPQDKIHLFVDNFGNSAASVIKSQYPNVGRDDLRDANDNIIAESYVMYVDPDKINYIVIPPDYQSTNTDPQVKGTYGDVGMIMNLKNGDKVYCIVAERGNAGEYGEVSIGAAKNLPWTVTPRDGGSLGDFMIAIFVGVAGENYWNINNLKQQTINELCSPVFSKYYIYNP